VGDGNAAQLTATNRSFLRGDRLCIALATNYLPVSLGPSISIVLLLSAIAGLMATSVLCCLQAAAKKEPKTTAAMGKRRPETSAGVKKRNCKTTSGGIHSVEKIMIVAGVEVIEGTHPYKPDNIFA